MIPFNIFQTHKTNALDKTSKALIFQLNSINNNFKHTFMDNDECLKFIESNFNEEFVSMYKGLPLDIMRADVWRIAVIYIYGGIYIDTDVDCKINFEDLIKNQELVLFSEPNGATSNFFFAAKPKHPAFKKVLDLFVERKNLTVDTSSTMLVQNFGMDLFHKVMIEEQNKKVLTFEESEKWVVHLCRNTWKKSEEKYKVKSNSMKPITFFTTFHKAGYDLYGKKWIETFIENAATQRSNIKAVIFADGFSLRIDHPQITIVDFKEKIPEHSKWKQEYLIKTNHSDYVQTMTVRFSHKGFVIQKMLKTVTKGYAIWLDGDSVFLKDDYQNFPEALFKNQESVACQVEDNNHVESGILIFNMESEGIHKFADAYSSNYKLEEVLHNYGEPYDGHVARRSLDHSKVKYYDLNKDYGVGGIQSDPNATFLHPEIKNRFRHNIGVTGKSEYESWDSVKDKDQVFNSLDKVLKSVSPKFLKIKRARQLRERL